MRASAGLGAPAPEDVVARAQQYYGQEGASVRPGSAAPSLLKQSHGGGGSASALLQPPPEVLQYASQFAGVEGAGRPSSAPPSGRGIRAGGGGLRDPLHGPMPLPTGGVVVGPTSGVVAMAEHHGEEEAAEEEDGDQQGTEDNNMHQQQLPHYGGNDSRSGSELGSDGGESRRAPAETPRATMTQIRAWRAATRSR